MRLGIIGAMDVEISLLKDRLERMETVEAAGLEFYRGVLRETQCVVVRCGVGKVNAACCVQALVDRFEATHIINTGVAGSLDTALHVGDIVVSEDAVYHDVDVTNLGYEIGQMPGMELSFPADRRLMSACVDSARLVAPDCRVVTGRVASGDQFVYEDDVKHKIRETFHATCCEMEGASIAHACSNNGIPFVIIRAISDNADGSDAEAYPIFEEKAARKCAHITEHVLERL